jgi:hypothetical protein
MGKSCFVIGPIGEASSETRAHANDLIEYIINPAIAALGYDPAQRADHMPEPGRITTQIIRQLNESDVVIADLSFNNPNVFYEVSIRHAIGRAVVHMAVENTRLPFDLRDNRTIFFTMQARRAEEARSELKRQIVHLESDAYRPSNPILEAVDVISLQSSDNDVLRAIGAVNSNLEVMASRIAALEDQTQRRTLPIMANMNGRLTGLEAAARHSASAELSRPRRK